MSGRYQEGYNNGWKKRDEELRPEIERLRAANEKLKVEVWHLQACYLARAHSEMLKQLLVKNDDLDRTA